jgi:hypothetical protein
VESAEFVQRREFDRRRRKRFVVRERRSGFERRLRSRSGLARSVDASLAYLRDNAAALVAVLVVANLLSLLDLMLTMYALPLGAREGNPFMRYLFEASPEQAAAVKVGAIVLVSLFIWKLRRYRLVLGVALFALAAYAVIVTYECVMLVHLA